METSWRKSTKCESSGCVEVAEAGQMILVRDSKNPHGPTLSFTRSSWRDFVAAIRDGAYDKAN
ncbi:DUF397 domain-containing protein [Allorhizocola rhizosphaerae]|uniref:DUF397 domain-containing protein n=1 Tax=Allorhizocola rhizosphaerae TaxID=1872709 RepID=UPI000E3BA947|nr:DUF397 domain-containing protein [Allorhizocola rhizosphaerae]